MFGRLHPHDLDNQGGVPLNDQWSFRYDGVCLALIIPSHMCVYIYIDIIWCNDITPVGYKL